MSVKIVIIKSQLNIILLQYTSIPFIDNVPINVASVVMSSFLAQHISVNLFLIFFLIRGGINGSKCDYLKFY